MARKRGFDNHKVLDEAARTFAQFGYAATSVDQLVEATGLRRGSLYLAYASKAGLFRACLEQHVHKLHERKPNDAVTIDLIIIALWERAAVDNEVNRLATIALPLLESHGHATFEHILSSRLIDRAHITIN